MAETHNRQNFTDTIKAEASGDDTVKLIVKTINDYSKSKFVQETVKLIEKESPTKADFLKNLFGVACKNVQYLADQPGHEVVYTPLKLMRMGKGDCKKFTVFIGAILKAAGYDAVPKVVKYDTTKDWEHIYIITRVGDKYITLDPVNHCKFNSEVQYNLGRLNYLDGTYSKIMEGNKLSLMGNLGNNGEDFMQGINQSTDTLLDHLQNISGVGCEMRSKYSREAIQGIAQDYMNGVNDENQIYGDEDTMGYSPTEMGKKKSSGSNSKPKSKKSKEEKKEKRKKFFHKLKKFDPALASIRVAFLTLVKMGGALQKVKKLHINIAAHLSDAMKDPVRAKPVLALWDKFGGKPETLMKAIVKAGKSTMKGLNGSEELSQLTEGTMSGPELAIPAVIAASTPLLIPIIKMLKKDGKISQKDSDHLEAGIDTAEDLATQSRTDGGLSPASLEVLSKSKLIQETAAEDNGGNLATVRDMRADSDNVDFNKGSETGSSSGPQQYTDATDEERKSMHDQNVNSHLFTRKKFTASDALEMPVKLTDTPQAQGAKSLMNSIYNPTSWIQITFIVSLICSYIHLSNSVTHFLTGICITAIIITSINLFINKKSNNG